MIERCLSKEKVIEIEQFIQKIGFFSKIDKYFLKEMAASITLVFLGRDEKLHFRNTKHHPL